MWIGISGMKFESYAQRTISLREFDEEAKIQTNKNDPREISSKNYRK